MAYIVLIVIISSARKRKFVAKAHHRPNLSTLSIIIRRRRHEVQRQTHCPPGPHRNSGPQIPSRKIPKMALRSAAEPFASMFARRVVAPAATALLGRGSNLIPCARHPPHFASPLAPAPETETLCQTQRRLFSSNSPSNSERGGALQCPTCHGPVTPLPMGNQGLLVADSGSQMMWCNNCKVRRFRPHSCLSA